MVQMYEDLLVWLIPRMNCFGSIETHGLYFTLNLFFEEEYNTEMELIVGELIQ